LVAGVSCKGAGTEAGQRRGVVVSVQSLNEFAKVARRGLAMRWTEVSEALQAIRPVCRTVVPVDIETHGDALRLAERHSLSVLDALIIAATLRAQRRMLLSEDMHDGLAIDRRLHVVNPLRCSP
jgi:predicted nucleic acid-binding protein